MPYAITASSWRAINADMELLEGERLVEQIPQSLIGAIAAQDLLRETSADLNARTRLASAQVTALQSRVDAINDAIVGNYALPEEVEEKPLRAAMLTEWKKIPRVSRACDRPTDLACGAGLARPTGALQ
ncbi:hypothetical protein [Pseudomonas sp. LB3P14]